MRKITHIVLTFLWLFSISLSGFASSQSGAEMTSKNIAKKYNYSSGTVEANLKHPKKGEPAEMAYEFLELNKKHFRMKEPRKEMVIEKVTSDSKVTRVILKQVYNGIAVDGGARIWFNSDGNVDLFKITYYDNIDLPTTYSIDSLSAIQITLKDIGAIPETQVGMPSCPSKPGIMHSSAFDFRNEDRLYLIWPVTVLLVTAKSAKQDTIRYQDGTFDVTPLIGVGSYVYYIDALTGRILKKGKSSSEDSWKYRRARRMRGSE